MALENEIAKKFKDYVKNPDTAILHYHYSFLHSTLLNHKITSTPIHSEDYTYCNAVVLLRPYVAGLSHYDLKTPPELYLPKLIEEILGFSDIGDISSVLVGGNSIHFQKNKKLLDSYGITVIGGYLDYWDGRPVAELPWLGDCNILTPPGNKRAQEKKHVLVIPETQEVLMYSKPVGYVKLA